MADQIGEVPAEAGPVEEVGDVVALGPAFAMLALAPAEVQAAPHGWEEVDNDDHLDGDLLVGTDWMQEDNLWGNLPEEHAVREQALAVAMAWHRRLGPASLLAGLDVNLLPRIIALALEAPLRVPTDFRTVTKAFEAAVDGQTVVIEKGVHSLVRGASGPTRLDKRLCIIGEHGAVLEGGLQLGFESGGGLKNLTIKGHLWIYDGEWFVENCSVQNFNDACMVACRSARVRLEECRLGGRASKRASHGIIVYGDARVHACNTDFAFCSTTMVTGGRCRVAFKECDIKDCESVFSVLRPGDAGFKINVLACEIIRCGRIWLDDRRPLHVEQGEGGNFIHADLMGASFWGAREGETRSALGSFDHHINFPGGTTI
mmetsp:Transcript_61382/g.146588  ORF Transcript_61382/g.146588 Transcript_61382/m.146588 type:complete len:373 (+) Transcript_61382:245-1363(+)